MSFEINMLAEITMRQPLKQSHGYRRKYCSLPVYIASAFCVCDLCFPYLKVFIYNLYSSVCYIVHEDYLYFMFFYVWAMFGFWHIWITPLLPFRYFFCQYLGNILHWIYLTDPCSTVFCDNQGECHVTSGVGQCVCQPGFSGNKCKTSK